MGSRNACEYGIYFAKLNKCFRVELPQIPPPHVYEVRPRKDKRGFDPISDALPFGGLWYGEPNAVANAIGYAEYRSRSHDAMIRVYDDAGNVIETRQHTGDFSEVLNLLLDSLRAHIRL